MSNRADKFTPLSDQTILYSDFLIDFNVHPITKDLVRIPNERAAMAAMKNLILTNVGERLYQPEVGSKLRSLLFDQVTGGVSALIERQVSEMLKVFEPRVKVFKVNAVLDEEQNGFILTITFYIINKSDPITFNVTLSRVR